jgi:hypothetical protein
LSLYLSLQSPKDKNFVIKFKFGIISKSGEIVNAMSAENAADIFNQGRGWLKFVSHEELFNAELLPDNKLTIVCEVILKFYRLIHT